MFFTGEYRHTIDSKGRLIVPSRMREVLSGDRAFLMSYLDGCIAMFSEEGFNRFQAQLATLQQSKEISRDLIRTMGSSSTFDEVDKQGRVTVPQKLRDYAGIQRDVVIIGSFSHAEIWAPDRWSEKELDQQGLNERAEQLSF